MVTTIDQIAETLRSRKETAIAAYYQLVIDLGNESSKAKPETIEQILRDSGKSIEDLDADARRSKRRSEDRATIETEQETKKQIASARAAIEAANEELEEAKRARNEKVYPLTVQISEAESQLNAIATAKATLLSTMWQEDQERLKSLNWQVERLHRELTAAKSKMVALRSRTEVDRDAVRSNWWLKDGIEPTKPSATTMQLAAAEERVTDAQRALDAAIDAMETFRAEAMAR